VKNLILPHGRNHVQQYDGRQSASNRNELDRERSLCRLVIIDCGLRLQKMRNLYEKKNEQFYCLL